MGLFPVQRLGVRLKCVPHSVNTSIYISSLLFSSLLSLSLSLQIGSACSMAAGALTFLMGGSPFQIGHAASMAMEHCLGLTCDPCEGLVQIPCIERNAFFAQKAFTSAELAILEDGRHPISFDEV